MSDADPSEPSFVRLIETTRGLRAMAEAGCAEVRRTVARCVEARLRAQDARSRAEETRRAAAERKAKVGR